MFLAFLQHFGMVRSTPSRGHLGPRTLNGHGRNVCQPVAQQPHDSLGYIYMGYPWEKYGKSMGYIYMENLWDIPSGNLT